MLVWLKRLFGVAEEVVNLAERQARAKRLGESAISTFTGIVIDLETAAQDLRVISEEAQAEADLLIAQADEAVATATKNLAVAAKIRGLLED